MCAVITHVTGLQNVAEECDLPRKLLVIFRGPLTMNELCHFPKTRTAVTEM